jgi:hypothetical protein
MAQAGMIDAPGEGEPAPTVLDAVRNDPRLTDEQRAALLAVYRSYVDANRA